MGDSRQLLQRCQINRTSPFFRYKLYGNGVEFDLILRGGLGRGATVGCGEQGSEAPHHAAPEIAGT
eukprot:1929615-Rhodomonas_salina.1